MLKGKGLPQWICAEWIPTRRSLVRIQLLTPLRVSLPVRMAQEPDTYASAVSLFSLRMKSWRMASKREDLWKINNKYRISYCLYKFDYYCTVILFIYLRRVNIWDYWSPKLSSTFGSLVTNNTDNNRFFFSNSESWNIHLKFTNYMEFLKKAARQNRNGSGKPFHPLPRPQDCSNFLPRKMILIDSIDLPWGTYVISAEFGGKKKN